MDSSDRYKCHQEQDRFNQRQHRVLDRVDPIYPYWRHCNTLVLAWIVYLMDPVIVQSVQSINNAHVLWLELKKQYSQTDQFRILDLREEIYKFQLGDLSVTDYFIGLKSI